MGAMDVTVQDMALLEGQGECDFVPDSTQVWRAMQAMVVAEKSWPLGVI